MDDQQAVIAFLSEPSTYGPAIEVDIIETHVSLVFLAGDRAYKLKRAVKYPYLDFSTPEHRRRACEAELALNRRTAPSLYLEVRPLARMPDGKIGFERNGPAIDWLVVMRRFEQSSLFDALAQTGGLSVCLKNELADHIADFHALAERRFDYGGAAALTDVAETNHRCLVAARHVGFAPECVDEIRANSLQRLAAVGRLLDRRRAEGRVRRCHGDLHLRNICLLDGKPTLFDCLEFSDALASIDVLYDLAFLLMDLEHRGLADFSNLVLNRYLDLTDEDDGLPAMPRWLGTTEALEHDIRGISDATLWQFRTAASTALVEYARDRLSKQLAASGATPEAVEGATHLFDAKALTVGFARRFASYKRPDLLLHDPARLLRLLTNPQRPMQLIMAGKAHPADQAGQALIQEWTHFIRRPEVRPHVIFLSDYDMLLTEHLVQGVDVWVNTPRRPWEAYGTSGMKVLVNGGINLSELDGWWAEAYAPELGWALGDGQEHGDDPAWDAAEAGALYDLLERAVIPGFYTRDEHGIPAAWVARMRESMARLTPRFSSNRAVREYTGQHYLPAAATYRERAGNEGEIGVQVVNWRHALDQKWSALRFGEAKVETDGAQHVFEVQLYLDDLDPKAVRVELYADGVRGGAPVRQEMKRVSQLANASGGYVYGAAMSATRAPADYTARAMRHRDGVAIPLEDARILWQR